MKREFAEPQFAQGAISTLRNFAPKTSKFPATEGSNEGAEVWNRVSDRRRESRAGPDGREIHGWRWLVPGGFSFGAAWFVLKMIARAAVRLQNNKQQRG